MPVCEGFSACSSPACVLSQKPSGCWYDCRLPSCCGNDPISAARPFPSESLTPPWCSWREQADCGGTGAPRHNVPVGAAADCIPSAVLLPSPPAIRWQRLQGFVVTETLFDHAVIVVGDRRKDVGDQGTAPGKVACMNGTAQQSGTCPGPCRPAEWNPTFSFPQDRGTAHAVTRTLRQGKVGLPALMDDHASGRKQNVATIRSNPQGWQSTGTRNMQPWERALDSQPRLVHGLAPDRNDGIPDPVHTSTVVTGASGNHGYNRSFRPFPAETIAEGLDQALHRYPLMGMQVQHPCRPMRTLRYRHRHTGRNEASGFPVASGRDADRGKMSRDNPWQRLRYVMDRVSPASNRHSPVQGVAAMATVGGNRMFDRVGCLGTEPRRSLVTPLATWLSSLPISAFRRRRLP